MLLVYGLDQEKLNFIQDLAQKYSFTVKEVQDQDTLYTAGHLAQIPDADPRKFVKEDYPEGMEFLLFCQIDREALYGFLQEAHEKGYQFPHKAVLTETTKAWPFSYLLGHIAQEHQVMQAYNRLGKKIKQCQDLQDPSLDPLISQAKSLAQLGDDLTLDHILDLEKEADQALKNSK